jgi:pheromone shutdown protein TraB
VNIYQNIIQDILKTKPKRVLVLIGVGHIKAVKNYLEVHPVIKIVDTGKYLE